MIEIQKSDAGKLRVGAAVLRLEQLATEESRTRSSNVHKDAGTYHCLLFQT